VPTQAPPPTTAPEPTVTVAIPETGANPAVAVDDQPAESGIITISEVVSDGPGWIVIHIEADGAPGTVIGFSPVVDGTNSNVEVEIDTAQATPNLFAMLHTDAGAVGTYEFPGADGPVMVNGEMVNPSFSVTGLPEAEATEAPAASGGGVEVALSESPDLGQFLVDGNGMTLYMFTRDEADKSNCAGDCLAKWPPFLTTGDPILGEGVDASKVGTTTMEDGSTIVTYDHMPLYYWVNDKNPGDTTGQGVGEVWFVVEP
jgi:predicted lipoprotein with Yx(FWY)xxD motif